MRGFVILCLLALALLTLGARAPHHHPVSEGPRERMLLDGEWAIGVGGSTWTVRVPEVADLGRQRDQATYRTSVVVPSHWQGRGRVVLHFDRVLFRCRVLWNGSPRGEHVGNRTGFDVDVTDAVRWGAPNTLQVEAASVSGAPEVLRFYVTDLQHAHDAAITGDVWLNLRPRLEAAWDRVVTSVREGALTVTTRVENHERRPRRVTLSATVRRSGEDVLTLPPRSVDVGAGGGAESTVRAEWPEAEPWEPAHPTLYTLRTEVRDEDGRLLDCLLTRFGFREVEVREGQLRLNGRPLFLAGLRTTGQALERHALARDLTAWQGMGFNAVESHEEARLPGYYDVADELGMLVVSGNVCGGMVGGRPASTRPRPVPPAPAAALDAALFDWVVEERNHPSIVLWNPCGADLEIRAVVRGALTRADDTRPLPFRDYTPVAGYIDGRPPDAARGPWFIFETLGSPPTDERWASVVAPFLQRSRDSGAFGVVLNAPPSPAGEALPWPSTSGPDPRPPTYTVRADEGASVTATLRQALRPSPAEPRTLPPEVLVQAGRPGALVAVSALEGADMETTVQAADREGRAWFMLADAGRYRVWRLDAPKGSVERTFARRSAACARALQTYEAVDLGR